MGHHSGENFIAFSANIVDNKVVTIKETYELQALGYSVPVIYKENSNTHQALSGLIIDKTFINVANAYNIPDSDHGLLVTPYVNARVCYTHYQQALDGKSSSDSVSTGGTYDPYYVLPAERPAERYLFLCSLFFRLFVPSSGHSI